MTVRPPDAADRDWGGRLPLAEDGRLDEQAQDLADQLHRFAVPWAERAGFAATTGEGHLIGPWNAQLFRPGPATGFNQWVLADQQGSSLPPTVREVVILTVGVAWQADYEIYSHVAAARSAGLSAAAIDAIRTGRPGDTLTREEHAAHLFAEELCTTRAVREETYARALEQLGLTQLLDLVQLIGIYTATAVALNAFAVPAPPVPAPGQVS